MVCMRESSAVWNPDQAFCVFEFEELEPRLERMAYFDIVGF